jgi:hypothetical protein
LGQRTNYRHILLDYHHHFGPVGQKIKPPAVQSIAPPKSLHL